MTFPDRLQLLFGPYRTPVFKYGDLVICERAGQVELCGLSSGRIPWSLGRRGSSKAIVLCGALVRAVRQEAACAVAYWFGVTAQTVSVWRKALGVGPTTTGTSVLRGRVMHGEQGERMRRSARAKDRDPIRLAKIAAAKRGKHRPVHVVEAMRAGNVGRTPTEEQRRKMSESHRKRGTCPPKAGQPWTAQEDALVRTLMAAAVAAQTGRTLKAVYDRRHELKVSDGTRKRGR